MEYLNRMYVAVLIALAAVSCVKEKDAVVPQPEQIRIAATLADQLETRVSFTPGEDENGKPKLSLAWAEGDRIRVYNHEDHAVYQDYTLDPECVGSKRGTFSGPAVAGSTFDVEVVNPSLNYAEQIRPKDGSTAELKYIASAEDVTDLSDILFTDVSGALLIRAQLPSTEVASAIRSVDIASSEAVFFDNGINGGKSLRISLENPGDEGGDGVLDLYAYLPVGSKSIPEGTCWTVRFNAPGTDHTVYSRYVELGSDLSLLSGKLNSVKINCGKTDLFAGKASSDGSEAAPFLIADKFQMQAMHGLVKAGEKTYFKLVDDIDLEGDAWVPMNAGGTDYVHIDGNNHTLSNFTVTGTTDPTGLFSKLNGQVKDLTVEGATVTATTGAVGVLAGDLGNGGDETASVENVTIVNCHVGGADFNGLAGGLAGNIRKVGTTVKNVSVRDCEVTSKNNYIGGMIGYVRFSSSITGCTVSGSAVSGKDITGGLLGCLASGSCTYSFVENSTVNGSYRRVGGLVGWHHGGSVTCCGVEADVTVSCTSYDVGGLTGLQDDVAVVENAYSRANVSGVDNVGGLVGRLLGTGSVTSCYAAGIPSADNNKGGLVANVGAAANKVSKCISWNASMGLYGTSSGTVSDCYTKSESESGTVSSHAQESPRNWSEQVWDFSAAFPTLKNTGSSSGDEPGQTFNLIPYPVSLTPGEGSFAVLGAGVHFDAAFGNTGVDVVDAFASRLGVEKSITSGAGEAAGFNFLKDGSLGEEAYALTVTTDKVVVKAATRTGLFYAVQTLKQLMPAAVYETSAVTDAWSIPAVDIADEPRFGYRGFLLDVCRHFFTVDEVKKYLDLMAMYKMNRFHFVLTNDQGWRIPVPKYPKLITVGAYRVASPAYPGYSRDNGFYTKEQLQEIVRYAAERCITVVPEFDIPGHTIAALASYPELGCVGSGYSVSTSAGTSADVLCLGKDPEYTFVKDVLDEIMDIFPSEYIHIGGDEVPSSVRWKNCSHCLGLIDELGIGTEFTKAQMQEMGYSNIAVTKATRLQYHFMKQIRAYLASKGRKMIGWQESINDEYDLDRSDAWEFPNGMVESWTSTARGVFAAKKGIDVIMAPSWGCYFDIMQTATPGEPGDGPVNGGSTSNGNKTSLSPDQWRPVTLSAAYDWNPCNGIPAANTAYVKGVECAMWTEFISTTEQLEYMLLPRLAATAEVGWSLQEGKDFGRFTTSLEEREFGVYDLLGYNYRRVYE